MATAGSQGADNPASNAPGPDAGPAGVVGPDRLADGAAAVGRLTLADLAAGVAADEIDTVIVAFTDHYGRQMGKRFDADFFLDECAANGTHACDYLLTVDMEMTPVEGYDFANWSTGYGDFHLVADLDTLHRAAWVPSSAMVQCDVRDEATHELVSVAPRSVLRRQAQRASELGFSVMAASELEYFAFTESYRTAAGRGHQDLTPRGSYIEDYHLLQAARTEDYTRTARRALSRSGIPVETSKGEAGRGQHELNVRYTDVLAMADRHVVFKEACKEIADQLGISVTFMAKPHSGDVGSSCHIHMSLWDGDLNAFAGETELGGSQVSDTFVHFLGGWLAHASELMLCWAPTINSYKRYQDESWAPTRIAWSRDNRTAGFRVVGSGSSLRIENRLPGADCNPYLAFAAALAAGLDGIEHQLDPGEPSDGDVYRATDVERVPTSLAAATDLFERSDLARRAFGDDVVDHYVHFARVEQAQFDASVTDWERQRYFERI